jgi:hypothetical protein
MIAAWGGCVHDGTEDADAPLQNKIKNKFRASGILTIFSYLGGYFKRWSVGENGPGGTLARAGLDLLDVWSDGNATPHDRWSPLGEALAVTLAETRPFLQPFLSRF